MSDEREKLGTRLGFLLLSAGCAIGCGNVWKFPWMVGQYGGGAFVVLYLVCLVVLGLPVMTMEFAIGRAAQKSPVHMYQALEKKGQKWHWHGYASLFGNIALMAFYTVVTGWMIYYFVRFLGGKTAGLSFVGMITDPKVNVTYLAVACVICFAVLSVGLQGGLERVTKPMMILLFVLIVGLAIHSATLRGASEGLSFYLKPDFSKITSRVVVGAMNQAFFTLSIGMGSMAIFGSYVNKDQSLLGESRNVIILDTIVALLAGFIMFPACSSFGLEVNAGPSLLFDTMATVFTRMSSGRLWGSLFFLFMVFAAMSTMLAVCENIVAMVRDLTKWGRMKASVICGVGVFLIALTTALGYSRLNFHPFGPGSAWLDFWDFIVSNNILPLGSLVFALFCCNKIGWGWEGFKTEANLGRGIKVEDWMKPIFRFVVPVCIIIIYVIGIVDFF